MTDRTTTEAQSALRRMLASCGSGPILVHSDLLRASAFLSPLRTRTAMLQAHADLLLTMAGERPLWVPTFNYDFPKTRSFDVQRDPAQLGPFPEFFRTQVAHWRTPVPVFSVAGTGPKPPLPRRDEMSAFEDDSIFAAAVRLEASVLFYGASLNSATILHHAEFLGGGPLYRYDKIFPGTVRDDGASFPVSLRCHVRPLGKTLEYDWPKLADGLARERLSARVDTRRGAALCVPSRGLCSYWASRLNDDPLYLLNEESKAWVVPLLKRFGRRFLLSDFESG